MYPVFNRASGRLRTFRKEEINAAFEPVLAEGRQHFPFRLPVFCLMSNHWRLLVWPQKDSQLSSFLQWITLAPLFTLQVYRSSCRT